MNAPLRRGSCPGLSAPMQTGDGLLVRLLPIGTVPLAALGALCAAAREFGNGIVEVTARGSIQVRGLDAASAPRFAAAVGALGIAAEDGVPVHANPLAGLDPLEAVDAGKLAADLRRALSQHALFARLSPKASVVIDGGGALGLDQLAADVRLRAEPINGAAALHVSVGGDQASAARLGHVALADGVETATRLLEALTSRGRVARARDLLAADGIAPFSAAVADLLLPSIPSTSYGDETDVDGRNKSGHDGRETNGEVIGKHRLRDRSMAYGVALAFGHAEASSLECLTEEARRAGAAGMRAAPGRGLIVIGLSDASATIFTAAAERLGFIVRPDDPRRFVIACAGAPVCASAHLAARAIAPRIAADRARLLGDSFAIHVSGCAKGCAHSRPAALTIVGTPDGCALVANGSARDAPFAIVSIERLPAVIADAVREHGHV